MSILTTTDPRSKSRLPAVALILTLVVGLPVGMFAWSWNHRLGFRIGSFQVQLYRTVGRGNRPQYMGWQPFNKGRNGVCFVHIPGSSPRADYGFFWEGLP